MLIDDGKGRGYKAAVSSENKLEVCSIVRSIDLHCNQTNGESYSILVSKTPAGAGDCFLYLKNDDTRDIIISSVKLYAATTETITIKLGDIGTPANGTANTPANRKAGCGNVADMTCEDGTDITGLSGGTSAEAIVVKGGETSMRYAWLSGLVIPKNHTLTMYASAGSIAIVATLSLHFCECD